MVGLKIVVLLNIYVTRSPGSPETPEVSFSPILSGKADEPKRAGFPGSRIGPMVPNGTVPGKPAVPLVEVLLFNKPPFAMIAL